MHRQRELSVYVADPKELGDARSVNMSRTKRLFIRTRICSNLRSQQERSNSYLAGRDPMLAGATEKLPGWEKPHAHTVALTYDMEGHAKKCVEMYCELANKNIEQSYKVSTPCVDDHQCKKEELKNYDKVCLQNRPDMLEFCSHWQGLIFDGL